MVLTVPPAFFEPDVSDPDRYAATALTRGPWDPRTQHAGPPAALMGRAIERCEPRPDRLVTRFTMEILRPIPIASLRVHAQLVRSSRSVDFLTGSLEDAQGEVARCSAWRMRTADVGVAPTPQDAPPALSDVAAASDELPATAEVNYFTGVELRFARGHFQVPGPATGWFRARAPLVAGEPLSPLERVLIAADSGNGISAALDFTRHLFINTDLTVTLHRAPVGEWVCLDAATTIGEHGIGFAESRLGDARGWFGRAIQTLLIDERRA